MGLLDELFAMTFHAGIKPGLERIEALCAGMGDPHLRLPVVHVAGTNGKGSTSAMLASILQCAGYNVGLYTSPHISVFNERVRINGVMISDDDVERFIRPLMEQAKKMDGTFFEVTTAMAFGYFAEKRVDIAVIETGLGGRLDATNIVQPLVSVITSIDYDHMEYLGNTLESIAREKAGIIKAGAPAIVGPLIGVEHEDHEDALREVFRKKAASVQTSVTFVDDVIKVDIDTIRPDLTMAVSVIDGEYLRYYDVDLAGRHQANNIATVLATIPHLRDATFIDPEHVRAGLRQTRIQAGLRGRIQMVREQPPVVLDVSHNPAGLRALRTTLLDAGYHDGTWHVVFGAMQDKDITGMLQQLLPLTSTLHLCAPKFGRAASVEGLEQQARSVGFARILTHDSVKSAVELAIQRGPTLICGSFHVAEEASQLVS
jgi:dihydrofolate synthase / folylpolyglutamate synthase